MPARPDETLRRPPEVVAAPRRGAALSPGVGRIAQTELARRVDAVLDVLRRPTRRPLSDGGRAGSGEAKPGSQRP